MWPLGPAPMSLAQPGKPSHSTFASTSTVCSLQKFSDFSLKATSCGRGVQSLAPGGQITLNLALYWPSQVQFRSEERRVGKECRCRRSRYDVKANHEADDAGRSGGTR